MREHIPTPGSFSAAEGRAYLEATAEAVAASLRAMAVLGVALVPVSGQQAGDGLEMGCPVARS